jgi:hypothetical protein
MEKVVCDERDTTAKPGGFLRARIEEEEGRKENIGRAVVGGEWRMLSAAEEAGREREGKHGCGFSEHESESYMQGVSSH